jgi:hypothetical protein
VASSGVWLMQWHRLARRAGAQWPVASATLMTLAALLHHGCAGALCVIIQCKCSQLNGCGVCNHAANGCLNQHGAAAI